MAFVSAAAFAQSQNTAPIQVQPAQQLTSNVDFTSPSPGVIRGTVVDQDGAVIANATIVLSEQGSVIGQTQTGSDGTFAFSNVTPGAFAVAVSSPGFAAQNNLGVLQPGENHLIPAIQLVVATTVEVNVTQTREEIAEQQIHIQEKQRLLGVIPNFYVSYLPNPQPLNTKQKFELGWKSVVDPVAIGVSGIIAGLEQSDNAFSGYGQGAQGYAKRFGASYADQVSGTFIGSVILPTVFKQDPRYFYKGTGSRKSRFAYAVAMAVVCKGDNGRWQPNYSNMLGSLAAGGISNLYYPASNRNGVGLTFENALIGIGGSALGGVFEEFFSRKLTSHSSDQPAGQ